MKSRIGIYFLAVLLPVLASCDYRYELEGLRVQSKLYNLKASEGSTPVIIYAGGDWTVSLTEQVDWAELDRDHGSGQGQVMFTYSVYASCNRYFFRSHSGFCKHPPKALLGASER